MTAYIWEIFLDMVGTLRGYTLFLCLCLLLAVLGILRLSLVMTMIVMLMILLPIGVLFQNPQSNGAERAGRRGLTARYLLVLLLALMAAAFGLSAGVFASAVGLSGAGEALSAVLAALSTGLLVAGILLPLRYWLGSRRARACLYPVVLVPLVILLWRDISGKADSECQNLLWAGCGVIAALMCLGISYVVSCRIPGVYFEKMVDKDS